MLKNNKQLVYSIVLVLAAMMWGVAFVAQSEGSKKIGAFTFITCRMLIGGVTLLLYMALTPRSQPSRKIKIRKSKNLWLGGFWCGLCLFAGSLTQQIGVSATAVGKAGFLSALYILIVPIIGLLFGKKTGFLLWIGVALALLGMYFLCVRESLSIGYGEWMCILSAFCYSLHILVVDHFSARTNGVQLSCMQFFVCGLISSVFMLFVEKPAFSDILAAWLPILYAGVLSSGVGYTLQIIAQKHLSPALASLLMSLESVFSVLAGWILLQQKLSSAEILGCVLMFTAIVLAQFPAKGLSKRK